MYYYKMEGRHYYKSLISRSTTVLNHAELGLVTQNFWVKKDFNLTLLYHQLNYNLEGVV